MSGHRRFVARRFIQMQYDISHDSIVILWLMSLVAGISTARAVGCRHGRRGVHRGCGPFGLLGHFQRHDVLRLGKYPNRLWLFRGGKAAGAQLPNGWATVPATFRTTLQFATARVSALFHGTTTAQVIVQIVVQPIENGAVGKVPAHGFQCCRRFAACLVVVEVSIDLFVRRDKRDSLGEIRYRIQHHHVV